MIHGKIDIDKLLLTNADKNVSELGILRLKSETMDKKEQEKVREELIKSGISEDIPDFI